MLDHVGLANLIAPEHWDQALSGVFSGYFNDKNAFTHLLPYRVKTLAQAWNGTCYDLDLGDGQFGALFLVMKKPVNLGYDVFLDCELDGATLPGETSLDMRFYRGGTSEPGGPITWLEQSTLTTDLSVSYASRTMSTEGRAGLEASDYPRGVSGNRKVHRIVWPSNSESPQTPLQKMPFKRVFVWPNLIEFPMTQALLFASRVDWGDDHALQKVYGIYAPGLSSPFLYTEEAKDLSPPSEWAEGSGVLQPKEWPSNGYVYATLAEAEARVAAPLSSAYVPSIAPFGVPGYSLPESPERGLLFKFPSPVLLSYLWLDIKTQTGSSPNVLFYDEAGDRLTWEEFPWDDAPSTTNDGYNGTAHYSESTDEAIDRIMIPMPEERLVSAVILNGVNDYPQGLPKFLTGMYGPWEGGAAPPAVFHPFWTDYVKARERPR